MRIHFRERPWDLYLVLGYTWAVAAPVLASGSGNPLAILLVLLAPGYAFVALLFPAGKPIDWIQRIALSFGLSMVSVALLGVLVNFTPIGLSFAPIVVVLAAFTTAAAGGALYRRMRLPAEDRLSATLSFELPRWRAYSRTDRILGVGAVASLAVAVVLLGNALLTPTAPERFTELYLLGPGGTPEGYPTRLNVSEPGTVVMGIGNHEARTVRYTVRIDLVGVETRFNATSGRNETFERNRTTWSWVNVSVVPGQPWTSPYTFAINATGSWWVEFLLFSDGDLTRVYKRVYLAVTVPRP